MMGVHSGRCHLAHHPLLSSPSTGDWQILGKIQCIITSPAIGYRTGVHVSNKDLVNGSEQEPLPQSQ